MWPFARSLADCMNESDSLPHPLFLAVQPHPRQVSVLEVSVKRRGLDQRSTQSRKQNDQRKKPLQKLMTRWKGLACKIEISESRPTLGYRLLEK